MTSIAGRPAEVLERLLEESQATIQALLSDQVDAVVDPRSHSPILLSTAQQALRESEERYRRIVETTSEGIWTVDADSMITFASQRLADMLGYSVPEMVGQSKFRFFPDGTKDTSGPTALGGRTHSAARERQMQLRRKDGSALWVLFKTTPIESSGGAGTGTLAMMTDWTFQRRTSEALRTSEERMRFALQNTNVGVWELECATHRLVVSETIEAQFGFAPGTFGGTFADFARIIHPDDLEAMIETMGRAMKSGADFTIHHRVIRPDRTVRRLIGAGRFLLNEHGEAVRGIGISQDVTERLQLEEQYRQTQKMEAIGQLAGGVAHDFNNLLTVMLGYCDLLLGDLPPDDRHRVDIAEIQSAGVSATALARQLLSFSRKEIVAPAVLDLNAVVGEMQAMLRRLIREDVKIVLRLGPTGCCVLADRGQVEQIVLNLAVNARDAMPVGGTLTIETATVTLGAAYVAAHANVEAGPHVALVMTDTGTGMTPEVRARIFEPFFTTKGPGMGTGIGLATVYGIVERSGGSVDVATELGRGTAFSVYFPSVDPSLAAMPVPPTHAHEGGGETVLVIDDADGIRELARRLLERLGYTVLVASTADQALRFGATHPSIALLLSDVVMPGTSGPELAARLTALLPALKVIYMSGYTDESIVRHGVLNAGINLLNKPFTAETLGRKIREVLDR